MRQRTPETLPVGLAPLYALALDQRRTAALGAEELWSAIDAKMWETTRNPWLILQTVDEARLVELSQDADFKQILRREFDARDDALTQEMWCNEQIAYFSLEFGLSEALPIYSGGLGIIAGDHLKAASDIGVPITGVGLLYSQGTFRQAIDRCGNQREFYPFNEPGQMPLKEVRDREGNLVRIALDFSGRKLTLRVCEVVVGRLHLYLLDSNALINAPADRGITSEVYPDDPEIRLQQQLVLGIGGYRLLAKLGKVPDICHFHGVGTAFAGLERARHYPGGLSRALTATRVGNLVSDCGHADKYPPEMVLDYLSPEELQLGQAEPFGLFDMATLALNCSFAIDTAVPAHFSSCFDRWPTPEIPTNRVTPGVHRTSWEGTSMAPIWAHIDQVTDDEIAFHRSCARKLLASYLEGQLDGEKLTLCVAGRFSPDRSSNILLSDPERLIQLLDQVQIVVAGKAHPKQPLARAMIRQWHDFIKRPEVAGRVIFLADYDLAQAERLVQGVDLWVNFSHDAISGMKVLVNGGLNLALLEGWWAQAYDGTNGWVLDLLDGDALYTLLEEKVIPEFYEGQWAARVRASLQLADMFSADRMVREYADDFYQPLAQALQDREGEVDAIVAWKAHLAERWETMHVGQQQIEASGTSHLIQVEVDLGEVDPQAVAVQIYGDSWGVEEMTRGRKVEHTANGYIYSCFVPADRPAGHYTCRIIPYHRQAKVPLECSLIKWQK